MREGIARGGKSRGKKKMQRCWMEGGVEAERVTALIGEGEKQTERW